MDIHAVIIYFALCLSIFIMIFMSIICIMYLCRLFPLKSLLVWKGYFEICKYVFLKFEKGMSKKIASGSLGFVSVLLSIFEKGISKKLR